MVKNDQTATFPRILSIALCQRRSLSKSFAFCARSSSMSASMVHHGTPNTSATCKHAVGSNSALPVR